MATVFVFASQTATSKAGKPYAYQQIQIVQSPKRPDVMSRHFVNSEAEALAPGKYTVDIYFRDTPTGLRPVFENFQALA